MEETPNSSMTEDSPSASASKKRSRIPIYIVGVLLLLTAIGGLIYWFYQRQFETTDDAFIEANIVQISPKVSSHIAKIHVKENQLVKKGDLLVELETAEFEAKVEKARAELRSAQAQRGKALANAALTRRTAKADLNQALSNYDTAQTTINQSKLSVNTKENAIIQAQAQVKTADAGLRQMQAQIPAAEANLAQTRAQVPAAQTRFEVAQSEYQSDQTLFKDGHIPRITMEKSRAALREAESNLETAKKQVVIAESQLNTLRRQIDVAASRVQEAKTNVNIAENEFRQSQSQVDTTTSQANESYGRVQGARSMPEKVAVEESEISSADAIIAQAEAALRQAELELSYTKIYAPEEGFVAQKTVQEGQLVQSEQSLMAISQPGLWVVANFKETQIGNLREGQNVLIYVDAFPGLILNGTVDSFQAGTGSRFSVLPPENASGNYVKVVQRIPVKIRLDEDDERLKLLVPGMSVVPKVKVK